MRFFLSLAMASAMLVAACAKQPENIAAVEIGQNEYRGYSCKQLSDTKLAQAQNLENLSAAQKSAASGDAVGVFLLGLPVSSMSGNDKETAIAVAKGHIQSIEREQARKNCK
ncbi:hypothetical protein EDD52_102457 [Primorskyibacter sedentarius]|uniref:Lipoprotein n=1 Tax=Primorskyibacter sedentarius TaxID=745311 RepID=A0A4R3JKB4_9RHOB|nr:hypothetical protein [Primorskyibacter sedentarius]TCS66639.1 hypothetical protein EDD52_102457 [Primorskyibacter sedentarius]